MGAVTDAEYMEIALEEARKALALGEVPVGAAVVQNGKVIAAAHNLRETEKNALAHAETRAIDIACKALGGWRLPDCTLYVTLEPCLMCAGAILNARIDRVVYGAADPTSGALGSKLDARGAGLNHTLSVTGGVSQDACAALLKDFFRALRKK